MLGFGVKKEYSLGKVVREGLIEKVIFRLRQVKSEGASHRKRLGMRPEEIGNIPAEGTTLQIF